MRPNCFRQDDRIAYATKRTAILLGLILFLLAIGRPACAQIQIVPSITTIAGTGIAGYTGDGGPATSAQYNVPEWIVLDSAGNLYVCDHGNNVIRRIDATTSIVTTVAGTGIAGFSGDGGPAASAKLNQPDQIAFDTAGNLYIVDHLNQRIRKVAAGTGIITTVVGTGVIGFSGDGGPATSAQLKNPDGIAVDSAGNIYIADTDNNRIRKVAAGTGIITTVAGTGTNGSLGDGGPATSAQLGRPAGLTLDTSRNLYIGFGPFGSVSRVRMIEATTGIITTLAGNATNGYSGDGGPATSAQLNTAFGIWVDNAGDLYIADFGNHRIRKVSSGVITTIAGNGAAGYTGDGGPATNASLNGPQGMVSDSSGNLYFSDATVHVIRKLSATSISFPATNVATSSAVQSLYLQTTAAETITSISVPPSQRGQQEYSLGTITGCAVDGSTNNLSGTVCTVPITFTPAYPGRRSLPIAAVTSTGNINLPLTGLGVGPVAALTPGIISTYAGNGTAGFSGDNGPALSAGLNSPQRIATDSAGNLHIADSANNRIRTIAAVTGIITTVAGNGIGAFAGDGSAATSAALQAPQSVAIDRSGNLYIADQGNQRIRRVNAATGVITSFAGNGTAGYSGDAGLATSAKLNNPSDLAFDSLGNLYIADWANHRIRKIASSTTVITTYAGAGTAGFSGDSGPATTAQLNGPIGLAVDSKDNLYIVDENNNRIRKVDATTGVITTVAGAGTAGYSGDDGPATSAELNNPMSLTIDAADNLYVSDAGNNRIRKVSRATGVITTIAGNGTSGYTGDGGGATSGQIAGPVGLTFDIASGFYLSDSGNSRIRKIDLSQAQLTYPTPTTVGMADLTDNPKTATVSNIGNSSLTVPPPSSGTNPSAAPNFTVDSASTCPELDGSSSPGTLAAGADCTYDINFGPSNTGTVTGSAVLTDTSLNATAAVQTIHFTGTGVAVGTTTTVSGAPNPSVYQQSVIFTASVAPNAGTALPTGSVQFSVDGTSAGSPVTLNSGMAALTISTLTVGTRTVTATYTAASSNFSGSNGSTSQVVNKASLGQNGLANIALTSSPNPSVYQQSVTFTATVPAGVTGTVQFVDGSTVLGTGTISGTTATFTTSALVVATHPVSAVYSGDANYNSATSAVDNHVVNNSLDFTLTLTSAGSQTVIPSKAAPYTVQIAPTNTTYPGAVTFTATGLPAGATATFGPATVAADGGTKPINVNVQTAAQVAMNGLRNNNMASLGIALFLFPFAVSRRMRRSGSAARRYVFMMLVLLGGIAATAGLTGCGGAANGNGFFGQPPNTYTITITATSGTIQHSVNVILTVQ